MKILKSIYEHLLVGTILFGVIFGMTQLLRHYPEVVIASILCVIFFGLTHFFVGLWRYHRGQY